MLRDFSPLELFADRLRASPAADPEIFSAVMAACTRLQTLRAAGKTNRFDQLTRNGAWVDAAFELVALEVPAWTVRRLVYEDGEWICSLSQQPNLPLAIDDTVDAHHPILPLAILSALVEARERTIARLSSETVPKIRAGTACVTCCDNFA